MLGLFKRRVVVEFEQVGALAVNTFMVVGFENDTFLACCWVSAAV